MLKVGTIGTSEILDRFLIGLQLEDRCKLECIYSRDLNKAKSKQDQYHSASITDSLDELWSSIDIVYIASPNSLHYQYAKTALEKGIHVLCEKPFVLNEKEATSLYEIAKKNHCMIFEQMKLLHLPSLKQLKQDINRIGEIKQVTCNFSKYSSKLNQYKENSIPNVFSLQYGGGALMDLNVYNVHFLTALFGKPNTIKYVCQKGYNGVDLSGIITFQYDNMLACAISSKESEAINGALIQGSNGYIKVTHPVSGIHAYEIVTKEKNIEQNFDQKINMYYDIKFAVDSILSQDIDAWNVLMKHTIQVIKILDDCRKQANIQFDGE